MPSSRTFAAATTSWLLRCQRLGGWPSRSASWSWPSDAVPRSRLQRALGQRNATAPVKPLPRPKGQASPRLHISTTVLSSSRRCRKAPQTYLLLRDAKHERETFLNRGDGAGAHLGRRVPVTGPDPASAVARAAAAGLAALVAHDFVDDSGRDPSVAGLYFRS